MRLWLSMAAVAISLLPFASQAQEGRVSLELNKLESAGEACRSYVVLQNGSGTAFSTLKLDLVMFDTDGVVAKRLALETAPLPADKTSLKVFDIGGMACEQVGRILLNDVLDCVGADGPKTDCLGMIDVTARGELSLIK
jgi:hypothetical protein